MFGLGGQEIIVIVLLVALVFGAKKIPDLAKSMGSAVREFKKEMSGSGEKSTEEASEKASSENGK
jgi:twin arginine-targeting protein translocase, TatA/E family